MEGVETRAGIEIATLAGVRNRTMAGVNRQNSKRNCSRKIEKDKIKKTGNGSVKES